MSIAANTYKTTTKLAPSVNPERPNPTNTEFDQIVSNALTAAGYTVTSVKTDGE